MRNIKFRAWDVKDKEFLEVGRLYQEDEIYVVEEHPDCGDRVLFVGESGGERKNEVELMQYTGLKDKNGMVIYEGDIVQTGWQGNEKGVVVFESSTYCVDSGDGYMYFNHPESYEVIGNVYENPELLGDRQ